MATKPKSNAAGGARGRTGSGDRGRCWKGYEPVPGKKPYSKGSRRKK